MENQENETKQILTSVKILVPFDDDQRSLSALDYAAMLALVMKGDIMVMHVADAQDYTDSVQAKDFSTTLVRDKLRPKLALIQKRYPSIRKIDLRIVGSKAQLHEHIITFAKENRINMIVMRHHKLPDISDFELHFLNTTAYNVVLNAPCPVFTFANTVPKSVMKNILLPLDLSDGSLYKIPQAVLLARHFSATLHLLSATEDKGKEVALREQLDTTADELSAKGLRVKSSGVHKGTLLSAIERYTQVQEMDLIVIMSFPGFRWSDLWVSPKAKQLISRSKTPMLSIRAEETIEVDL